ncbi:hypothetical protein AiwAL_02845 [Acidiphilium sp. AL]|uniref:hypothetical protein n=1 Tax=Acidiphilium sp. AL TaxID=2871704 RepID=UPI0021CB1EB1|nr:hypothetical protein [Acidiphilium sp. AL]MCU4159040.1 hypothetical protein [Acidiphilium sp. AL]
MWALRFSRQTVIAAVEVMEGTFQTHEELTRVLLKFGSALNQNCNAGSLSRRFNHLISFYDADPEHKTDDGGFLQDAIVEKGVLLLPVFESSETPEYSEVQQTLLRMLRLDGFEVKERNIQRTLPEELKLPQAQDQVIRLLDAHNFATPKGHFDQALDAHARGNWASANAQLRVFFESLLDEIAIKLDPGAEHLASSENRREMLASKGFLDEQLNEWGNGGKNFINGLWKRLHPQGPHPGLSDEDDSTFRRHLVLLTTRLLLMRFDTWPP